jgi:hypothetical protein
VAKIDKLSFGSIVIDGKKYRRDVLIFADGTVKKRKGGFFMFGSHNIKKKEIEELIQGDPDVIVVGTGTDGVANVAADVESWAKEKNLSLMAQPSSDAVAKLNDLTEQKKRAAALIHITC